jgi:hypothetical protein
VVVGSANGPNTFSNLQQSVPTDGTGKRKQHRVVSLCVAREQSPTVNAGPVWKSSAVERQYAEAGRRSAF